jgi:hypothetical protein
LAQRIGEAAESKDRLDHASKINLTTAKAEQYRYFLWHRTCEDPRVLGFDKTKPELNTFIVPGMGP